MSWFFLGTWLGHIFGLFFFLVSIIPQDLITYMHNEDYQENLGLKFNFLLLLLLPSLNTNQNLNKK
jgi:hypothetical protein